MTALQFKAALALAKSDADLSGFDMDSLFGFGCADFVRVCVPLGAVARCMRWQGARFDGSWDEVQTGEDRPHYLKNVEISDWLTKAESIEYQHEVMRKLVEGPEYAVASIGNHGAD